LTDALVIIDREELGELWLAWYSRRSDETQAADLHIHAHDAQRLRLAQFCDASKKYAEVHAIHWPCIEAYIEKFRTRSEEPIVIEDAYTLEDGWLLPNGNHRCCAIYLLEPSGWEVRLAGVEPPAGCLDALPGLS
jgi:hypothetical protein